MKYVVVITNDDGIDSPGLSALVRELRGLGEIFVVAPRHPCSACSHKISVRKKPQIGSLGEKDGARWFVVFGSPADCILYAMPEVVKRRVDLVISGINSGANVGLDVHYSGTVAGAKQAFIQGIPAIAVSLDSRQPRHFDTAAKVVARWAKTLLNPQTEPLCLCINIPDVPYEQLRGEMLVRQDLRDVVRNFRNSKGCDGVTRVGDEWPTDKEALSAQMVSVLPLSLDMTNEWGLRRLEEMEVRFWSRGQGNI